MSGNNEIQTEQLPLMSPQQENMFNKMLEGVFKQMRGFPLGQAYGGPVESSWQSQPFMGPESSGQGGPDMRQGGNPSGQAAEMIRKTMMPGKGKPTGREGGGAYESILNSMGPEQGLLPQPNSMTQLLTSPFTDPFTQGMTGNYPRGRA